MAVSAPAISGTARNMAAFRALETAKPPTRRLFTDPFAKRFLPVGERALVECARLPALRWLIEQYVDRLVPGARTSGVARTRLIDDWLREETKEGARQVVVLGAGFDCRALRLSELRSIRVFEVDRQPMVAYKRDLLPEAQNESLVRIGVDFLKDNIEDRLLDAGFDKTLQAVIVWEGVTNYLDRTAVDSVFKFIGQNTPPGSKIIFTYVHADALTGHFEAPGLQPLLHALEERGEPWTFGFNPAELPDYLSTFDLSLTADLGAAEYRRLYWPELPTEPIGYEFYRVVLAERASNAAR